MRIYIDTNKLTDSPYHQGTTFPFTFDDESVNEIVNDIKNGNPTCYLISGYRGAGKSSFVNKIEETVSEENNAILFIHVNFAKYKSQNFLLRKLIRGVYQSLNADENVNVFNNLKSQEQDEDEEKRTSVLLGELYERTFHEVTSNEIVTEARSVERTIQLDLLLFISFLLALLLSLSNLFFPWFSNRLIPTVVALLASAIGAVKEFMVIQSIRKSKSEYSKEFQRKVLYDDEIADLHFYNLLEEFHKKNIKLVFVLDELDKVKTEEVNDLINEMKPYLISGKSSFIVVAGQELFYKYKTSQSQDDSILSTLFSRIIHVPLLTIAEFHGIFSGLIDKSKTSNELNVSGCQLFVDYLIFKSKRVPRRFVNLIREKTFWRDDGNYLEIDNNDDDFKICSSMIKAIQKIDDQEVAINFSGGSRDYLVMQLFIKAERILGMSWKGCTFTKRTLENEADKLNLNK